MQDKLRNSKGASSSSGSSGAAVTTLQQIWDTLEPLYLNYKMNPQDRKYYESFAHGVGTRPWQAYNALPRAQKG